MLALAERLQQRQDLVQGRGLAARSAPRTVRQRKVAVVYASVDASDVDRSVPAQRSPQASQASRLRNSPAYKRLMNSSWHDTYKKNEGTLEGCIAWQLCDVLSEQILYSALLCCCKAWQPAIIAWPILGKIGLRFWVTDTYFLTRWCTSSLRACCR